MNNKTAKFGYGKTAWIMMAMAAVVLQGCADVAQVRQTALTPAPGRANAQEVAHPKTLHVDLGGGVKLELVWIPPGEFLMGSPADEAEQGNDETEHRVKLTQGLWMGKYEVTQEQWKQVMGSNPSHNPLRLKERVSNPVDNVSWNDCQAFVRKVNNLLGSNSRPYAAIRLPTEAEWEYACRAGARTRFYSGTADDDLGRAGWYLHNSGESIQRGRLKTHPVGQKAPNAWGLYDMHGNVAEWCEDWYHNNYADAPTDGSAWLTPAGSYRVLRGGSWYDTAYYCRSASRDWGDPRYPIYFNGLRVVAVPPSENK